MDFESRKAFGLGADHHTRLGQRLSALHRARTIRSVNAAEVCGCGCECRYDSNVWEGDRGGRRAEVSRGLRCVATGPADAAYIRNAKAHISPGVGAADGVRPSTDGTGAPARWL